MPTAPAPAPASAADEDEDEEEEEEDDDDVEELGRGPSGSPSAAASTSVGPVSLPPAGAPLPRCRRCCSSRRDFWDLASACSNAWGAGERERGPERGERMSEPECAGSGNIQRDSQSRPAGRPPWGLPHLESVGETLAQALSTFTRVLHARQLLRPRRQLVLHRLRPVARGDQLLLERLPLPRLVRGLGVRQHEGTSLLLQLRPQPPHLLALRAPRGVSEPATCEMAR